MPTWAVIFFVLVGTIFLVKLIFVLSVGGTLPATRGAIFVPSSSNRIRHLLDSVSMKENEIFVDLGCGDGRVLRAARKRNRVTALGFEINPLAFLAGRLLSLGKKEVSIKWGSFWSKDLRHADIVFCYLFPDVMDRLAKKLEEELRPGTRVVSCNFFLPGWNPQRILTPDEACNHDPIYLYIVPMAFVNRDSSTFDVGCPGSS